MKHIFTIIILLMSGICSAQFTKEDTASIKQFVFQSVNNKLGLVTNDVELFHSVVHGSLEEIEKLKLIEFQKALARRKPIAVITTKCR